MELPVCAPGPREKLSDHGIEALSEAELLALLLGTGTSEEPVTVLAQRVLCELGGLAQLARASGAQLATIRGIGGSKSARIAAGLELGRRVLALPLSRGTRLASSEDVYRVFGPLLSHKQHEELWAIALDARQRVLTRMQLARGGLGSCPVTMGDVFRPLLREGAAAVIVVHNHPSGSPEPSAEDLAFTERLAQAGALLGIALLDHVIVAADGYFSCLDAGLHEGGEARSPPRGWPAERFPQAAARRVGDSRPVLTAPRSHAKVRPPTRAPRPESENVGSHPSVARPRVPSQSTRLKVSSAAGESP